MTHRPSRAGESGAARRVLSGFQRMDTANGTRGDNVSGADVGARNADGNNALWLGCVSSNVGVVRRLIEAGIEVDNRNDTGATALMYAASSGKADMLALLLGAGADAEACNQNDSRAIDLASTWECLTLLRHWPTGRKPEKP